MLPFPPPFKFLLAVDIVFFILDTTDAQQDQYYQCDSNNKDERMKCPHTQILAWRLAVVRVHGFPQLLLENTEVVPKIQL